MKTRLRLDITPPGWALATTQAKKRTFLRLGKLYPQFVIGLDAKSLFVCSEKEIDTRAIYEAAVAVYRGGAR